LEDLRINNHHCMLAAKEGSAEGSYTDSKD
jgi:hypothetical protein